MKAVITLMQKDIRLEWRQRYAINGMLLYLVSTVVVCYMSFGMRGAVLPAPTWNALFWIILLFTAVTAVARSFDQERAGRFIYMYSLASPEAIIIAKMVYNSILLSLLSFTGLAIYSLVLGNPVQDMMLFSLNLLIGALGLSGTLTLVAGIAGRAGQNSLLMPVLSFPITIPMLLMLIRVSKNAVDGLDWSVSEERLLTLLALNMIVITLSYLLFPYLWRS